MIINKTDLVEGTTFQLEIDTNELDWAGRLMTHDSDKDLKKIARGIIDLVIKNLEE